MTSYDPDYFPRYTGSPQKAPKSRLRRILGSREDITHLIDMLPRAPTTPPPPPDWPNGGLLYPDGPRIEKGGHRPDVSPRTPQGPGISGSPRSPQGPIGPGGPRDPWPSEAQWQQGTRSLIDAIKELNKFNAP